ncbi:GroES-like protein [Mycena galopus ATCC 62051]|nr:GroES-like protein [Mycena galopus ATCC 62051]
MSTQQAIVVPAPKEPFIITTREIPTPQKGEVLLKILSVGLNPINFKQRAFDFLIDEYPAVLGSDVAGTVEALGEGVYGFKQGDRVFAQTLLGGFQQYLAIPAAVLIRIPDNTSFDEAATFPITFSTACVGLFAPAPIGLALNPTFSWDKPHQGESALVIGGGTSVGQFAIQLLKFIGFTRIVVYASKIHFDHLKKLGATECIDRAAVPEESLAATLKTSVKVAYDIGAPNLTLNVAYDCVVDGGSIVTTLPTSVLERDLAAKKVVLVRVQGYIAGPDLMPPKRDNVAGYLSTADHTRFGKLIITNLPELLEKKKITALRCDVLENGLAGILGGLERLKNGNVRGVKLVGHPQD